LRSLKPWIAATAAALLAAACAPGASDDDGEAPDTGDAAEIETDPANLGELTLTVWDQEIRGGQDAQIEALNAAFQDAYPSITIDRVSRSFDDLLATLRLAITDEEPPDVVQANNGRPQMGAFVEAGLLTNLDPYAEVYGWGDRFGESVLSYARYSDDAVLFGEGNLWGVPQMGEVVGVFYNREKLDELDLEVPTTWDELDAALAAATDADELALQFGNLDQWPGIHLFGAAQSRYVPSEQIRDLGFGNPGADWTSAENVAAAEMLGEWIDAGYLTPDFNGVDPDSAWQAFAGGDGVFLVQGTWLMADLTSAMGEDVGFFTLPGAGGDAHVATGGTSLPFAIPAASANADAAAAYIDFITTPEAMEVISTEGNLPIIGAADQEVTSPLQADSFAAWDTVSSADGLVPYLDWATPDFYDLISGEIQRMLAGESSPEDFLQTLQSEYAGFVGD
jgi:raffinose/stachyose/melibiose transport system substrate-binding protein